MYFIECRHFKDEHLNKQLVVGPSGSMIQFQCDNDIVLEEWDIPIVKQGDENFETCFVLDEKIFKIIKNNPIIIIFKDHIESLSTNIFFTPSDHVVWETWIPVVTCILEVPNVSHLEEDTVVLRVNGHTLFIEDGSQTIYKFPTLFSFGEHSMSVQTYYIHEVCEKYIGKVCKLYFHEESPLCIEFFDGHRIFVAPIIV